MAKSRGFTIIEILITVAIFSIISTISLVAIQHASTVWRKSASKDTAMKNLGKSWTALKKDLENSKLSPTSFEKAVVPASLGTGNDGDAICFLSPITNSGDLAVKSTGTSLGEPFMMRNIIYYLVVPQNHNTLFQCNCVGGADSAGYEQQCPHKVLIRVEKDHNATSNPADPNVSASENFLIPNWQTTQLTRPTALKSTVSRKIVATNLLTFRVTPDNSRGQLKVLIQATSAEDAARSIKLGQVPLNSSPYTVTQTSSFVCRNQ